MSNAGSVDLQKPKAHTTPWLPHFSQRPRRVSRRPSGRNKRKTRPPSEEQTGTFTFRHSMMCGCAVASASATGPTSTLDHWMAYRRPFVSSRNFIVLRFFFHRGPRASLGVPPLNGRRRTFCFFTLSLRYISPMALDKVQTGCRCHYKLFCVTI